VIVRAPGLTSLLDALRGEEQGREALRTELAGLDGLSRVRTLDEAAIAQAVLGRLGG
jgi:hypothetical protein